MANYEVIVGNVGTVYSGGSEQSAKTIYDAYVRSSGSGVGRAAGESVTLTCDGEPVQEHRAAVDMHDPELD